jgi:hypothetical protein
MSVPGFIGAVGPGAAVAAISHRRPGIPLGLYPTFRGFKDSPILRA